MRLIDADKLLENSFKNPISYNAFCNLVKRQMAVDAVPVVHGRWVSEYKIKPSKETDAYHCSVCHDYYTTESYNLRYCPRCGAKMDGKGNGNETD